MATVTQISNRINSIVPFTGSTGLLACMEGFSYGQELSSGTCTSGKQYYITATAANHFGSGKVVGNTFVSAGTETLDASNKVKEVIVLDQSGNQNNTSVFGSPTLSRIGSLPSLTLNGTTDFLQKSPSNLGTLTAFTMVIPFKGTGVVSKSLLSIYTSTSYGINVALTSGGLLAVYIGSASIYVATTKSYTGLAINSIFAISYNAGTIKIYENGIQLATTTTGTVPTSVNASTWAIEIGRWYLGAYAYIAGLFGVTAILPSLLTDTQIQTISNKLLFLATNVAKYSANDSNALGSNLTSLITSWGLGAGFTRNGDVIDINATGYASSNYPVTITNGKTYRMVYTVTNYVSGAIRLNLNAQPGTSRSANGTYSADIIANANGIVVYLQAVGGGSGTFQGTASIISVKEVSEKFTTLQDSNFLGVYNLPSGDISAISGVTAVDSTKGIYYDATNHLIYAPLPTTFLDSSIRDVDFDGTDIFTISDNYMGKYNNELGYFENRKAVTNGKAISVQDGYLAYADSTKIQYMFLEYRGIRVDQDGTKLPPFLLTSNMFTDLMIPLQQGKQGSNAKPDYDFTNLGLLFPQNDATEILYFVAQLPHGYAEGTNLSPHIHWRKNAATNVVWKMSYRWVNNFADDTIAFTTLTATSPTDDKSVYASGSIVQITEFPDIVGTGKGLSSMLMIKLWRDDNLTTGDVLAYQFDLHYELNSMGSRTEYVK